MLENGLFEVRLDLLKEFHVGSVSVPDRCHRRVSAAPLREREQAPGVRGSGPLSSRWRCICKDVQVANPEVLAGHFAQVLPYRRGPHDRASEHRPTCARHPCHRRGTSHARAG